MANGAQSTGGFTTREGQSVLVTPSGEIVGSADTRRIGGGGGGRRKSQEDKIKEIEAQQREKERQLREQQAKEQLKAIEEAQKLKEQQFRVAERQKQINTFKRNILSRGADTSQQVLRDANTGQRIKETVTVVRRTGERVVERENLDTGEKSTRVFERSKKGSRVRETEGIKQGEQGLKLSKSDEATLKGSLPTGVKVIKNKVGNIVGFEDTKNNQRLPLESLEKLVDKGLGEERVSRNITKLERVKGFVQKQEEKLNNIKSEVRGAASRREIEELAQLQRLGAKATAQEKKRREQLTKRVAKNYQRVGDLITTSFIVSLGNLGVGSVELAKAIRANPEATLIALPPAILEGFKDDFNRIASGDPLEIGQVGIEYYTFSKVAGLAGKTFIAPIRVAAKYAPKYFAPIARQLTKLPKVTKGALRATSRKIDKTLAQAERVAKTQGFKTTIRQLRKGKASVDTNIRRAVRLARQVEAKRKVRIVKKQLKKEKKQARKLAKKIIRKSNRKSKFKIKKEVVIKDELGYKQALQKVDQRAENIAFRFTEKFLVKASELGKGLTESQAKKLAELMRKYVKSKLDDIPTYRTLKQLAKLDKKQTIIIKKKKNLVRAQEYFKRVIKKINNLPLLKKIREFARRLQGKVKRTVKKVTKKKKKKVSKSKDKKALRIAKKRRKAKARKSPVKVKTLKLVSKVDYQEAISVAERIAQATGRLAVRKFIRKNKLGKRFTESQVKQLERLGGEFMLKKLGETPGYKALQRIAKLSEPSIIRVVKAKKTLLPKTILRKLKKKLSDTPLSKNIRSFVRRKRAKSKKFSSTLAKRIEAAEKRTREKLGLRRAKVRRKVKRVKRAVRRFFRPPKKAIVRTVTLQQLRDIDTIKKANFYIDKIVKEVQVRRNVKSTDIRIRRLKNVLKKRIRRIIKTKDRKALMQFKKALVDMKRLLNEERKAPKVVMIEKKPRISTDTKAKATKKRETATIKDTEFETPSDSYVEVRVGNQVMLQKVSRQTQKPQRQLMVVKSISKQTADLTPLLRFASKATLNEALQALSSDQKQALAQDSAVLQAVATDQGFIPAQLSGTLQGINSAIASGQAVGQGVSKSRSKVKAKTKTVQKKKKKTKKLKKKKKKVVKSGKVMVGYGVEIRRKNKFVKIRPRPLSLNDALDLMGYTLDKSLARTGRIVALGEFSTLSGVLPKMRGYFNKNRKKFRRYRIRRGKRIPLLEAYIEKKKFVGDTRGEVKSLQRAKRSAPKKKTFKKKKVLKRSSQRKNLPKKRKLKKRILMKKPLMKKKTMKKVVKRRVVKKKATRKKPKSPRKKKR